MKIPHLKINEILAPYTTYQIGGLADYFVIVHNSEELITAVLEARKNNIPYFILGKGANILFGDKGFRGLVIIVSRNIRKGAFAHNYLLLSQI